jgi:amphi-Trp domain-containing protein
MGDELLQLSDEADLSREAAAQRLRDVADQLSRHNEVEFVVEGVRHVVEVPDQVHLKVEVEIGEESELEIELTW